MVKTPGKAPARPRAKGTPVTEPRGDTTDHDLIVRMDERVKLAVSAMETRDIYHRQDVERTHKMFVEVIDKFTQTIVTLQQGFATKGDLVTANNNITRLERIVYGGCAVILLGFIGALLVMVFGEGAKP